jgi:hypothetical protein
LGLLFKKRDWSFLQLRREQFSKGLHQLTKFPLISGLMILADVMRLAFLPVARRPLLSIYVIGKATIALLVTESNTICSKGVNMLNA